MSCVLSLTIWARAWSGGIEHHAVVHRPIAEVKTLKINFQALEY